MRPARRAEGKDAKVSRLDLILASCLVLAIISFAVHAIYLLYHGHYSVTRQDYWRIYAVDLRLPFPFNALHKHNDHPVFFGSLIWLTVLHFFQNNQTLLFFCGLTLTGVSLVLLGLSLLRSPTLGLLHQLTLGLAYVIACLWVVKANIIASGGFSCMNSMTTSGCLVGLLALDRWRLARSRRQKLLAATAIVTGGLIASFSFGTGIAIWVALAAVVLIFRLGWKNGCWFAVGGIASAIIFVLLPNNGQSQLNSVADAFLAAPTTIWRFLQMLGAPLVYYTRDWLLPHEFSSGAPLVAGLAGLAGAFLAAWLAVRRQRSEETAERAELVSCGMMFFILGCCALITVGRGRTLLNDPLEALAPRYCFWTPFFWATLLTLVLYRFPKVHAHSTMSAIIVLLLTLGAIPSQLSMGAAYRHGRKRTEAAALRLVCRVEDDASLQHLFKTAHPEHIINPVARYYREHHLDMFAWPGAEWIHQVLPPVEKNASDNNALLGHWKVDRIVAPSRKGFPVAHFSGWCVVRKTHRPADYVIVHQTNRLVVGLARFTKHLPEQNRRQKVSSRHVLGFEGYIGNYSEKMRYECLAAVDGKLIGQGLKRLNLPIPEG